MDQQPQPPVSAESTPVSIRNAAILVIIIVTIFAAGIGGFVMGRSAQLTQQSNEAGSMDPVTRPDTSSPDEGVMCTMDAQQCPDGSWVGRSGPNCEFVCPGSTGTTESGSETYVHPGGSFSLSYPNDKLFRCSTGAVLVLWDSPDKCSTGHDSPPIMEASVVSVPILMANNTVESNKPITIN